MLFAPFARMMSDLEAFVACLRKLEGNPTRMRELRAALQRAREALVYSWLPRSYNASADVLHSGWDRTEPSALTGYLLREAINTTSGAAPKRPRHVRERDAGYLPRLGTGNRTDFCSQKVKMFLTVSRDSSTDRQQKANSVLINSTLSDKSEKRRNSNHTSRNDALRKILTLCQFPDPPIDFCEYRCIETLYIDAKKPTF